MPARHFWARVCSRRRRPTDSPREVGLRRRPVVEARAADKTAAQLGDIPATSPSVVVELLADCRDSCRVKAIRRVSTYATGFVCPHCGKLYAEEKVQRKTRKKQ